MKRALLGDFLISLRAHLEGAPGLSAPMPRALFTATVSIVCVAELSSIALHPLVIIKYIYI